MLIRNRFGGFVFTATVFLAAFGGSLISYGQQVTNSVPLNGVNNSFYENYNLHWGFQGRGFFFDSGGGGGIPPFGGFDPNAAAHGGFATTGRAGGFFFDFSAGQGSTSSIVSSTPMITLQNGVSGAFFDTSLQPFVVGVIPVVGGGMQLSSPLMERLHRIKSGEIPASSPGTYVRSNRPRVEEKNAPAPAEDGDQARPSEVRAGESGGLIVTSSANRGDLSVADIRRAKASEESATDREIETLIEQARGQEELGKPGLAKIFYQQAARRSTGEQQRQLQQKVRELSGTSSSARSSEVPR